MDEKLLRAAELITGCLSLTAAPADVYRSVLAAGDVDWEILVHHADGHSLTPLLYDTWRDVGALDLLPVAIVDRMAQAFTDNDHRNDFIREEVVEIHRILERASVPHLLLKGWPLVEQLYGEAAHRVLYDHDFLVPAGQARPAFLALQRAGFVPLPAKDEWVEKHLAPLWRNDGYVWDGYLFDPLYPRPVELHTRLWEDGWRGLQVTSPPDLWAGRRTCTVAGVPMQLLSREHTLIHLAVHFSGHLVERDARLNQLLDLARFLVQENDAVDWNEVVLQATMCGVSRFVFATVWLAGQVFAAPQPPPTVWQQLAQETPAGFRAWLLASGVGDVMLSDYRRDSRGQDYRLTFLAANSLSERLGIVRFAFLPPVDQLVSKYNLRHRWQGPIYYPRFVLERLYSYSRGFLRHS